MTPLAVLTRLCTKLAKLAFRHSSDKNDDTFFILTTANIVLKVFCNTWPRPNLSLAILVHAIAA